MNRRMALRAVLGAAVLPALPLRAQEIGSVLVIDLERFFAQTLYGQRLSADLAAATEALAAENRKIEADLRAEELSLTERRPTMDPAVFRTEADAFDAKVQDIRAAQDAKERSLTTDANSQRAAFMGTVNPILGQLMQERGASVILDRRTVFLWSSVLDITDAAIERVDEALGDGAQIEDQEDRPTQLGPLRSATPDAPE